MRILIVDDEFTSRKRLITFLSEYGECDIAVNGKEAIEAFKNVWDEGDFYDLICLDIKMPEMNGQEVLKEMRNIEQDRDISGLDGVKIIMTTALDDLDNIKSAFREQCEAYLIKPVSKEKLINTLKELGLLK
ncbi:MAG: response regulator [Candidatus Gastranaerophilales bacterium]|nr:response regulator [Candidatus Gastranaerophilales bacterium]